MIEWVAAQWGWIAAALNPLSLRRYWWWACVAAGWAEDWRNERDFADDKEAFANGRAFVIQTGRHLVKLQLDQVDWRGMVLGLIMTLKRFRAVCAMTWAGVKRDLRVFKEAFANGRAFVIQTGRHLVKLQLDQVDWRGMVLGLIMTLKRFRAVCAMTWAGVKRDLRVFWRWARLTFAWRAHGTAEVETAQRLATLTEARVLLDDEDRNIVISGTLKDVHARASKLRKEILYRKNIDVPAAINEHTFNRSILKSELADVPSPQALLGVASAASPLRLYAMGAAVVFAIGGWAWGWERNNRVSHVVAERNQYRDDFTEMNRRAAGWRDIAKDNGVKLSAARMQSDDTAKTIEAERGRQRAYQSRERRRLNEIRNVIDGVGEPPSWVGLLDAGSIPRADGGGSASASAQTGGASGVSTVANKPNAN